MLLLTPDAHAQNSDKAAAEALFNQGRSLAREGRFDEACPKFEASQQLDAGLGTLLFLADCYEKAGRLASAWATFREAVGVARARGEMDRAEIARVRSTALEPELLQLRVEALAPTPEGFSVTRNGVPIPVAALGTAVPVDAGTWVVRAQAPGFQAFEASVSLRQSDPKQPYVLRIPPLIAAAGAPGPGAPAASPPVPAAASQDTPVTEPPAHRVDSSDLNERNDALQSQQTIGLIVGGAGVVAAIASAVFSVIASAENDDSLAGCRQDDPNLCDANAKAKRDSALNHASIATVAGVIGGVAIAGGATLYFTAPYFNAPDDGRAALVNLRGSW